MRNRLAVALVLCVSLFPILGAAAEDRWRTLMDKAVAAHRLGDLESAESYLDSALTEAEAFPANDRRAGDTFLALATIEFDRSNYQDAEIHLRQAIAIFEVALGPNDTQLAAGLNALALAYTRQGKALAAEGAYRRALEVYQAALGETHPRVADISFNLAGLYLTETRYADAEPLLRRALAIRERTMGPSHPEVARVLESYALVLRMTGRADEAEAMERRVNAILKP